MYLLLTASLAIIIFQCTIGFSQANGLVPCPAENEVACVECSCDAESGFNFCRPISDCPGPLKSTIEIKPKNKKSKCPYGHSFKAQCTLCECSGNGRDHCAMCFALPVRRLGQSEEINKKLPQATDNRFFNYEINGWDARPDEDFK